MTLLHSTRKEDCKHSEWVSMPGDGGEGGAWCSGFEVVHTCLCPWGLRVCCLNFASRIDHVNIFLFDHILLIMSCSYFCSGFSMFHVSKLTHLPLPLPPLQQVSPCSFAMCCISKLTSQLLPISSLQWVSPHLWHATFPSSLTHSSLLPLPPL